MDDTRKDCDLRKGSSMIISTLEENRTNRYVYFDDTGTITSISGRTDDTDNMYAMFELDDILPFIDGTYKFSDYTIKRNVNPLMYDIVKRKVNIKQRSSENQITKITELDGADINIEMTEDAIVISASAGLVERSNVDKNQSVIVAGTDSHPFFITHKDRPEFLISIQMIKFSDLLSGEKVTINYDYKYNISVYTRKYFDSYSLRRA